VNNARSLFGTRIRGGRTRFCRDELFDLDATVNSMATTRNRVKITFVVDCGWRQLAGGKLPVPDSTLSFAEFL